MDAPRRVARSHVAVSLLRSSSYSSSSAFFVTRNTTHTSCRRFFSCVLTSSRSILRAPVSPPASTFASTHAFRSWAPSPASASDEHTNNATPPSLDNAEQVDSNGSGVASTMAHPYSARAYRARLQQGNYVSLRELTRAAYAPSPLQVLIDLLSHAATHPTSIASASCSSFGLHHALARAVDVQWVLHQTTAEAQDTVLAAETVGDAASHAALQGLLQQLETLANAVDAVKGVAQPGGGDVVDDDDAPPLLLLLLPSTAEGSHSQSSGGDAAWVLPEATHVSLLRGVLQLAAIVGSPVHALSALDELIALQERLQRGQARDTKADDNGGDDHSFSMDDALTLVDAAAQRHIEPMSARDHLCAMQACAAELHRDFRTTLSLYHRFVQHVTAGRFAATADDFTTALVALAHSSRTTMDFTELRALLVESEAAAAVPVSVVLYTALIDAASRAAEEPRRMAIALSLYRRLRDGALTPTADTYAALIACCASTQEPTQAFAFYHEARQVCGVASFPPRVYTNLLLSYTTGGFGADAKKTLEVLVDAGAPLTRASFHAALGSAVTVREAEEMLLLMTERYHILPTPHTYSYLVRAIASAPAGLRTALQLFDTHEEVLRALARLSAADSGSVGNSAARDDGGVAVGTPGAGVGLEPLLLERYPAYVRALEHALMRLRVDPAQDPRVKAYLTPLVRVAQQRMNAFAGMPPQSPQHVPAKEHLCVAVLAADVLANLDEWVLPFMSHYSVLVIPYSALLSLQQGSGRRVEGAMVDGAAAGLHDPVWQSTAGGGEQEAVVEHRRRRLQRFLAKYRDVVHLVSLDEELRWSRETRRYGVGITDLFARAAAVALHLSRQSERSAAVVALDDADAEEKEGDHSSVYARHPSASIVLVSADYEKCGRYVVALKRAGGKEGSAGLQRALRRVSYHNPRTNPNWVPPTLSISQQQQRQRDDETLKKASATAASPPAEGSARPPPPVVDAAAASAMYRNLLSLDNRNDDDMEWLDEEDAVADREGSRVSAGEAGTVARAKEEEDDEELSAELLMSLLNA